MQALEQKLQENTGKTVKLTNIVDLSILGGVKLKYAGREWDGSVSGRFDALRQALLS